MIERYTAGGAGTVGNTVYMGSGGTGIVADASAAGTTYAIGIVVSAPDGATTFASGDVVDVAVEGRVTGFSGATPGIMTYQSNTAGALDTAAGDSSHKMGRMRSATTVFLSPALSEA